MIAANLGRRHSLELIGRFCGCEIDDAGGRIATVECALRSAQHFYLRQIVEFLFKEVVADEGNIIQRDGHGRIGGDRDGLGPDSAQLDAVAGKIRFGEAHIRDLLDEVRAAGGLGRSELLL